MKKEHYELMKAGWLIHDFIMNEKYDSSKLDGAREIFDELNSKNNLSIQGTDTEKFLNLYYDKKRETIIRRGVLADFENVAVEIFGFVSEIETLNVEEDAPGKHEITNAHIDVYSRLGIELYKYIENRHFENEDSIKIIFKEYLNYSDSAIDFELGSFADKPSLDGARGVCYEIFYVLSSGTIVNSFGGDKVEKIKRFINR